MALNSLNRRRYNPANTTAAPNPYYPHISEYDPCYDMSLPLSVRKQHLLDSGIWIDSLHLSRFGISREEQAAAWIAHPTHVSSAANWSVPAGTDQPHGAYAYQRFGLHAHAHGWCVFPETDGVDGERKPASAPPRYKLQHNRRGDFFASSIDYKSEELRRWSVKTSKRRDVNITAAALVQEVECVSPKDNMGIVIGPASGNVRVLDIDVVDEELAHQIRNLAIRILGLTPFIRVGRAPKLQMIYRVTDEDMLQVPSRSWVLMGADGEPDLEDSKPRNAVEWLGYGRHFTCYGLHHKTRQSFDWSQGTLHPAIAGPENAPVVSSKQYKEFLTELYELRKFVAKGGSSSNPFGNGNAETTAFTRSIDDRVWIPKTSSGDWIVDKNGIVVDGREDYIAHLSWVFGGANADLLMAEEGAAAVLQAFIDYATKTCADGKAKERPAEVECRAKWPAVRKKWRASLRHFEQAGEYIAGRVPFRINPTDGRRPCAQHIKPAQRPKDGSLDWLPNASSIVPELADRSKIKGVVAVEKTRSQVKSDREIRAIIEDAAIREAHHHRVSAEVKAALGVFLDEVLANELAPSDTVLPIHLLMAPTGGGKTTMTIGELAALLKANPRKPGQGPVLIAMPTHANAEEGLKTAARFGMTVPEDFEIDQAKLAEKKAVLEAAGLIVEVFAGKEKAGCKRVNELMALIEKGIAATNLCGKKVDDEVAVVMPSRWSGEEVDDEETSGGRKTKPKKEILCPVREAGECGYWQQHEKVDAADIVFVPHAYLTTPKVPKSLANPRALFIDESTVFRLLHTTLMPLAALEALRPEPWLTKAEQDSGIKPDDQLGLRDIACDIALKSLAAGRDVAGEFFGRKDGKDLIDAALSVCKRAHTREKDIRPDLTLAQIQEIANRPKGEHLAIEQRFWKLINDRFNRLFNDEQMNVERIGGKRSANGDRDARVRVVTVTDDDGVAQAAVRLSWRSLPNWHDKPIMLLDASASPRIMKKIFGREIVEHRVTAPMHVRTVAMIDSAFSNASFIPRDDATDDQVTICAWNVQRARSLIMKTAVAYAHGPVIVGMTKAVREVIFAPDWNPPPNVTPMHFGALRGLDFAKNAVAALSIGRSEMPIHIVDGYVAALTYDDDCPEQPYDLNGNGLDANGKPLMRLGVERRIRMRTGEDWDHYVPSMPVALSPKTGIGPSKPLWSGEIELQWREEELRQFLGRLRPVYRDGQAPVWICMSKVLPEDVIVDDIVALDDVISDAVVWDAFAAGGGMFAPGVTDKFSNVAELLEGQPLRDWVDDGLGDDKQYRVRMSAGLLRVRYQLEHDGPVLLGEIAAFHADPEAVFRSQCRSAGVEPVMLEMVRQKSDIVPSLVAKRDKLAIKLDEARTELKAQRRQAYARKLAERVHRLLPPEEGLTVEYLAAKHSAGEDIEALLISWLHSWRGDRYTATMADTAAMWADLKAQGQDAVDRAFGIAACTAAE